MKKAKPGDRVLFRFGDRSIPGKLVMPHIKGHEQHACFVPDKLGTDFVPDKLGTDRAIDACVKDKGYFTCDWITMTVVEPAKPFCTKVESKYRF